jgi:hypothetical protein
MGKSEKIKTLELTRRPAVSFTEEEHRSIKVYCAKNDLTIQDFIRNVVLHYLDRKGKVDDINIK